MAILNDKEKSIIISKGSYYKEGFLYIKEGCVFTGYEPDALKNVIRSKYGQIMRKHCDIIYESYNYIFPGVIGYINLDF